MVSMAKSLGTPEFDILRASLAELRKKAGFSQRALAAKLGVWPSWVAKVECGERRIDLVEFCWFCKAISRDPARAAAAVMRRMASKR